MKRFGTKQIVPLCLAVLCGVFIYTGLTKYGFWNTTKAEPTAAFVPTIICVILLALCLVSVVTSLGKDGKAEYHKDEFMIILAAVAVIASIFIIGMLPSLALFVVLWLKLVEKSSWKNTLLILAIVMAIVVGVFVLWLKVQFPWGLLERFM